MRRDDSECTDILDIFDGIFDGIFIHFAYSVLGLLMPPDTFGVSRGPQQAPIRRVLETSVNALFVIEVREKRSALLLGQNQVVLTWPDSSENSSKGLDHSPSSLYDDWFSKMVMAHRPRSAPKASTAFSHLSYEHTLVTTI
jgi:hypothetical protein